MADKDKLKEIKKLADAMYYAAFNLTTDASRLKKAMDEYHQFIIQEYCREEPVSEDLEEAAVMYAKEEYNHKNPATLPDRCRGCYAPLRYAFMAGAEWQKEQMIEKANDAEIYEVPDNNYSLYEYTHLELFVEPSTLERKGFKDNDKVKVIIIKED